MPRMRSVGLVAAAVGALLLGGASAASAGSYNGSCESAGGEICLYRNYEFAGGLYDTVYSKTNYDGSTYYGTSTLIDNTLSSAKNMDMVNNVGFYSGKNYTGTLEYLPAGLWLRYGEDTASSHCFSSNAYCPI
ncbi:peptidase inhibitor family I36 protein [Streptomyces laculatispora]|uniref:peptidase inhibitor family I36 protein n=1 Tax=Streptomyces laculatispora TaxID=887464 RepID=UPI001A93E41F|nr:peptidase inhibitor family I36 protein [Streptomyces laculatispora]MBO0913933.1 peptidase inhibitor family I36 protein [Streptomyces laculatispora]